jgi:adenylate kinase
MESKDIYIFIGPPGSGKGTLSDWCTESFGWKQLSTGNLCRQHVEENSPIGHQIDFALKSGKLVSDHVVTEMVLDWFTHRAQCVSTVILDGFPRTMLQARLFHQALEQLRFGWSVFVIELEVDDGVVVQRLANRCVCANKKCQSVYSLAAITDLLSDIGNELRCKKCSAQLVRRNDDTECVIKERLVVYRQHRDELMGFYDQLGLPIRKLDAGVPQNVLFTQFEQVVKSWAV